MTFCQTSNKPLSKPQMALTVFKISAGPRTLTGKIWVGPASSPLSYINFGKIVLRSGKFQILFWRLRPSLLTHIYASLSLSGLKSCTIWTLNTLFEYQGPGQDQHTSTSTCRVMSFTHWGWVTYTCMSNLTIIASDNLACCLVSAKPLSEPMLEYS